MRTGGHRELRGENRHTALTAAIADALRQRGVEAATAVPLTQVGTIIFQNAFDHWIDDDAHTSFELHLRTVTATLSHALTTGPKM